MLLKSFSRAFNRLGQARFGRGLSAILLGVGLAPSLCPAQLAGPAPAQPVNTAVVKPEVAKADQAAKPEKPKWDVNAPPGPARDLTIDVTEGTWLSVDLSPDGKWIAFDLLGDLYIMPASGCTGEQAATAITSGVAWDMQPRFSPDGTTIAFTSDRGGGDNIWTISRQGPDRAGEFGGELKQVTKESYRLLNSPAWAPDGQFIVAHKHFTSRRSLGSGEMWLYHITGGDGLQMTVKPNEQKDVGEPMFSPDGKYLYYSIDSTPGDQFEYNRDSTAGIYSIDRLDRQTGEIKSMIAGPGGAVRPTPSRSGTQLAYVKRDRTLSELWVLDTPSGKVRKVTAGLERDMQEAWAVHGVYPTMAWTPDDRAIVLWAGGKIQRVDVATGAMTAIPFRVKSTRRVEDAVRFPIEVSPDKFDVKLLRSVTVSPKGDLVAYQALGHLYTRELPEGEPRRVTTQNEHFEFSPSFSRDGASIVYTTWNDEKLGTVRVASTSGGEGRVITTQPGHYVDPTFTPDGSKVLFGRVSGGGLTTPIWSYETGLYWSLAQGGPATRISKKGRNPQFGADNDRVFLTVTDYQKETDHTSLISMKLDSTEERTHVSVDNATEFAISPDGKWLASVERFNAYIMPFVATGREMSLSGKSTAVPVARVTKEAGRNIHWSGDSTALHWSLGPELFTRKLADSFAFIAGAPEKLPDAPATGVNISFKVPTDTPTGKLAFVGGRVITMNGEAGHESVLENAVVVVDRNRIVAVGARATTLIPADATVIDCTGKTLMPGIIDVHAHGSQGQSGMTPQKNWGQYANLAFGVTTIHDPSNDTDSIFAASELAKAGMIVTPRIFSTGTILYGATGSFKAEIDSLDDALFHLRRMKAVGAFSVKSYNQPRREQRQQVIEAARQTGMMVVPEGGSLFQHNLTMVVDGHTGVEHSLPVQHIYKDVQQLWGPTKVGYTPTLIVGYGGLDGESYMFDRSKVWENERLLNFVPRAIVDTRSRRRQTAPDQDYNVLKSSGICKSLLDVGVKVQLGAHGQLAGLGAQWELWLIALGGLTPMQALRAATLDGAFYIGLDKDLGSIEVGKLADLLVLDANPLENIRNSEQIKYTVANGRIFEAKTMAQVGNHASPAPKFYWADLQGALGMQVQSQMTGCAGCGRVGGSCTPSKVTHDGVVDGYR